MAPRRTSRIVTAGAVPPYTFLEVGPGFWLMDWLVEESVELMGAALLCAAAVAYAQRALRDGGGQRVD